MNNFQERLKKFIEGLLLPQEEKDVLLGHLTQHGVSQALVSEVGQALDRSAQLYEEEVERKTLEIREEADKALAEIQKEYFALEKEELVQRKEKNRQEEEKRLEDARKKISSV